MYNKYIFNLQGFDLTAGITITDITYGGVKHTLSTAYTANSSNDIIELLTRMALVESIVEAPANNLLFTSNLDFSSDLNNDTLVNILYFTYNTTAYVVKADGNPPRTLASWASTHFPLSTITVGINKYDSLPLGMLRLIINGRTVFFGDAIAFAIKYNRTYSVDGNGVVTINLSYPNPAVVDPFSTMTKFTSLLNDILELGSYGNNLASAWSYSNPTLTMTGVGDMNLTANIQANINNLQL